MHSRQHTRFRLTSHLADKIEEAYSSAGDKFVIADLGCGKGLYHEDIESKLEGLGDREVEIIGFDIEKDRLEENPEADTAVADLVEYGVPLEESSVDFVYSSHLRCQIEDEDLEELKKDVERVLRDGGEQYHLC